MKITSYKDLRVWQKAMDLAVAVYGNTKYFPKAELYGITSQMRRAAFAIPANIAEGYSRGHIADYRRFLRISYSSGAELETHLLIAQRVGLLKEKDFIELSGILTEVMKMLNVLMKRLQQ